MKLKVGVYSSHQKALQAIEALAKANYALDKVSIIGKAEIINDHVHVKSYDTIKDSPLMIGSVVGPVLGLISGLGVFAIPGFGFLYGAGALIGTIAGFDLGVLGGGILTLLATIGIKKDSRIKYEEHLNEGKFLVIVEDTLEKVKHAEKILHTEGIHLEWYSH